MTTSKSSFDRVVIPSLSDPTSTIYKTLSFTVATVTCYYAFLPMLERGKNFPEQIEDTLPKIYDFLVAVFGPSATEELLRQSAKWGPYLSNFFLSHTMVNLRFMPKLPNLMNELSKCRCSAQINKTLLSFSILALAAFGEGRIIVNDIRHTNPGNYSDPILGFIGFCYGFAQGNESGEGLVALLESLRPANLRRLWYSRTPQEPEVKALIDANQFYLACLSQFSYEQGNKYVGKLFHPGSIEAIDNRDRHIVNLMHYLDLGFSHTAYWLDQLITTIARSLKFDTQNQQTLFNISSPSESTLFKSTLFDDTHQAEYLLEGKMPSAQWIMENVILNSKPDDGYAFRPTDTGNWHPLNIWAPPMLHSSVTRYLVAALPPSWALGVLNSLWRDWGIVQKVMPYVFWYLFAGPMICYGVITYLNADSGELETDPNFYLSQFTIGLVMMLALKGIPESFATAKYPTLSTTEWLHPVISTLASVFIMAFFLTGPLYQASLTLETAANIETLPQPLQTALSFFWLWPKDDARYLQAALTTVIAIASYNQCFIPETITAILVGLFSMLMSLLNYIVKPLTGIDLNPKKEHLAFIAYMNYVERSRTGLEKLIKDNILTDTDRLEHYIQSMSKSSNSNIEEQALLTPRVGLASFKSAVQTNLEHHEVSTRCSATANPTKWMYDTLTKKISSMPCGFNAENDSYSPNYSLN